MITDREVRDILRHSSAPDTALILSPQGKADPIERALLETLSLDAQGTFPDLAGSRPWEVRSFEFRSRPSPRSLHMITGVLTPHRRPPKREIPKRRIKIDETTEIDFGMDDVWNQVQLNCLLMELELPKALDALPGGPRLSLIIGLDREGWGINYNKLYFPASRWMCLAAAQATQKHITLVEHAPQSITPLTKLTPQDLVPACHSALGDGRSW